MSATFSGKTVDLTTVHNEMEAALLRNVLREEGIESWQRVAAAGAVGVFGVAGFHPTVVEVREEQADSARAVLDRRREESVDIDWDEVDVGEPEDELASRVANPVVAPGFRADLALAALPLALAGALVVAGQMMLALPLVVVTAIFMVRAAMIRARRRRRERVESGELVD